jgi:asparagine N-glycosylation enzyme membrane subunit Stt3
MIKKAIHFFGKHKKISGIILILILGAMFYCSSLTGSSVHFESIYPSILYHFTIFFGFAFFLLAIISDRKIKMDKVLIAIIVSLIVAILDEFHQSFVPFRDPSINDVLTDLIGSTISAFLCYFFNKK